MAFIKLNHSKLRNMLYHTGARPCDLARYLGLSRQLVSYILWNGGRKHVSKLAKYFNCKESDLLINNTPRVRLPAGFEIVNNKVRKVPNELETNPKRKGELK